MNPLKQLAGQTAIYGLGTIVPRLLNYLLVPFYTRILLNHDYGIITELYAYIAFFLVLLTYGMETTYFRFSSNQKNKGAVLNNALLSVFTTSVFFIIIIWVFAGNINGFLKYQDHPNLIIYAAVILAIDAFTSILFAHLRSKNKAFRFSFIKIFNVGINLGLNVFFLILCPQIHQNHPDSFLSTLYQPHFEIEYILISNLIASISSLLLLLPQLVKFRFQPDRAILKKMLYYTMPLLIVGIAGMVNEVGDKILFKYLLTVPDHISDSITYKESQLGIYGANFKLGILMTLFVQMFRYAFEPFFFSQSKNKDARKIYADVMKYFILFCLLIFLGVTLFIDIFKVFIGPDYRDGLHIVPLILMAKLFLGVFVNLSIWYKLQDLTKYGAVIAIIGAITTILLNFALVPRLGYAGSAIAHFMVYFIIMTISYFWGRKHYPVPYDLKRIGLFFFIAMIIFFTSRFIQVENKSLSLLINAFLFILFIGSIVLFDKHIVQSVFQQPRTKVNTKKQ